MSYLMIKLLKSCSLSELRRTGAVLDDFIFIKIVVRGKEDDRIGRCCYRIVARCRYDRGGRRFEINSKLGVVR